MPVSAAPNPPVSTAVQSRNKSSCRYPSRELVRFPVWWCVLWPAAQTEAGTHRAHVPPDQENKDVFTWEFSSLCDLELSGSDFPFPINQDHGYPQMWDARPCRGCFCESGRGLEVSTGQLCGAHLSVQRLSNSEGPGPSSSSHLHSPRSEVRAHKDLRGTPGPMGNAAGSGWLAGSAGGTPGWAGTGWGPPGGSLKVCLVDGAHVHPLPSPPGTALGGANPKLN